MRKTVAVVDDDLEMGRIVKDLLVEEGFEVWQFSSAAEALIHFQKETPQVLITDHRMQSVDGLMLLKKVQATYPQINSIMMTAFGSIETAIDAMKAGAFHYIVKPFKNEELINLVRRAMEANRLKKDNQLLRQQLNKSFGLDNIIGKSQPMLALFELLKLVSATAANVLITGDSGTGKELVARALHNLSPRKQQAFVPINCSAIPENLLESELFGHVKGSFTGAIYDKVGLFQEANGGTLFLDEIGDLSLMLQAKLLRVLQDRQIRPVGGNQAKDVDVRIVSATHRDLKLLVKEGRFREDLFYRLNIIPVYVPPLHERRDDIPLLVNYFIEKFATKNNSPVVAIAPEALAVLLAHSWPGNVRELENVIERALILSPGTVIEKSVLLSGANEQAKADLVELQADRPTLERLEERYIKLILGESQNRKDVAAKRLGISRRTLYRKEKLYGMPSLEAFEPKELAGDIREQFI